MGTEVKSGPFAFHLWGTKLPASRPREGGFHCEIEPHREIVQLISMASQQTPATGSSGTSIGGSRKGLLDLGLDRPVVLLLLRDIRDWPSYCHEVSKIRPRNRCAEEIHAV